MKRNNETAKAATERRISEEINNRVFEESRIRNEKKRNAQDLKIEIAALSEVSDLQPADVKRIAEEVRNEFAGRADLPKKTAGRSYTLPEFFWLWVLQVLSSFRGALPWKRRRRYWRRSRALSNTAH